MRLRTAVTATVLAAFAVLGGAGFAAADNDGFSDGDTAVVNHDTNVVQFGDMELD
ncbi:hypothetical protein OKJ48_09430 [Streptomyces kunmingensis]|uniref:Uncharacterized protein n=1 Tax=Streptomyces kunmingensis TaxID=68225 RepID=A0ABU6C8T5_9ACTN|nr:hypothetical protein [Streptomyces kunmingensis]MEB3960466.1 hypothetical protein [Streptomyces kunmingensis]